MKLYSMTDTEFTQQLNIGKDTLATDLLGAGVIDQEQYRQIVEDYALIVAPSGMFGKRIKKVMGWEDDTSYFKTIKLNLNNNKDKKDVHQSEDSDTEGVDNGSE